MTWQESRAERRYQHLTDKISRLDAQLDRLTPRPHLTWWAGVVHNVLRSPAIHPFSGSGVSRYQKVCGDDGIEVEGATTWT